MAAFPTAPFSLNQIHTDGGRSWKWDGSRWKLYYIAGVIVSATAPTNPIPGMRWIHEDQGRAYEYLDGTWVELGGGGGGGTSGPVSYNDLTDLPALGTAAATASSDYATTAQGAKADSALQSDALTPYRTSAAQDLIDAGKAASSHTHDDRYYTEAEVDTFLAGKQAAGDYATTAQGAKADSALQSDALTPYRTSSAQDLIDAGKATSGHTHDDRYYTETEVDTFLAGKQAAGSYATAAQGAKADSALQTGASISEISGLQTALDGKQAAGSYATLVGGLVPASQLPSYVDDVIESANFASLPNPGESGKIYVADGKIYRWSGSAMVEISPSPGSTDAVTEGASNLYFTAARAVSALASTLSSYATQAWVAAQSYATTSALNSAISALVKGDVGLGNCDNTSDANKPVSSATQTALDGKAATSHSHGNITSAGAIGSTSGVPIVTGTSGVLQAGSFGTTSGTFSEGNHAHSTATTTVAGFMPATDKTKLDGATSLNTASAIVARDSNGGFSAGRIVANSLCTVKATPTIASSSVSLDLSTSSLFYVIVNSQVTITFSNPPASPNVGSFILQLQGDGSQRTVTWPASVRWDDNIAPSLTWTSGRIDTFVFFTHNGGTTYYGVIVGQNYYP